ncbi:hypothetical protein Rhe02_56340 [Rhizocola hellebori]|uniref:Mycothiol-dependent maleylpyruvate isomerase metal-binding domain-containing protein n=1 Tax=Rhizocola hellebori TaxID=1392758 RepID=A0A8J3QDD0_9ACTN|nr:hypothetical protein [Rhizocola hellebori]GIH07567.1 hypothetical protein Rhe02_56340 [Rhizocola hellebori]
MFTPEHLVRLGSEVGDAWRSGAESDWTARAGSLEWSCARTADHAVDTVFAPAIFLASRRLESYPEYGVSTLGDQAAPHQYIEAVATAVRVLEAVVLAAEPEARAVIWTRPQLAVRGPQDFAARGALELILHTHDVCTGLGVAFEPSAEICAALREHTHQWPMWTVAPGWRALTMDGPPWRDLLQASGRA